GCQALDRYDPDRSSNAARHALPSRDARCAGRQREQELRASMGGYMRVGLTIGALALGLALTACENFDPTDIFDAEIFNTKKKLPGERIPVFPQGTPGVPQGVPAELVKGYQSAPEAAAQAAPQTAPQAAPKEANAAESAEAKPKPKPKPKPKVVA